MQTISPLHPPIPTNDRERALWGQLSGASLGLAMSRLVAECARPVVVITRDTATAVRLSYEMQFFQGDNADPIVHFPDFETLPYDQFSPHQDIISGRLAALNQLPSMTRGALITPIATMMHHIAPPDFLHGNVFLMQQGDTLNIQETRRRLENAGYRAVPEVREHGEFAVRGAIIDLYPMGSLNPYRIDLFDNVIDSIRTFSTDNQRSLEKVARIELLPAKEFPLTDEAIDLFRQQWRSQFSGNPLNCPLYQDMSEGICPPGIEYYLPLFFEKTATLFDYLPSNTLIVSIGDIHPKADAFWHEIRMRYEQHAYDILHPILQPSMIFIPVSDFFSQLQSYTQIKIKCDPRDEKQAVNFATEPPIQLSIDNKAAQPLQALENHLIDYPGRVLFCAETAGRREVLLQLFKGIQLSPKPFASWQDFLADTAQYGMTIAPLDDGLCLTSPSITLIAEAQLFGKRIMQRRRRKETTQEVDALVKDLSELQIGSPIVHIDHGVGRYLGLQTLKVGEQIAEYLQIEYAGSDKLYVPVSALQLVSRYSGIDPEHAPLNKLGTEQWSRAKRKAAEQVSDVAAELLDLYAERAARTGFTYTETDGQYTVFANAFPFEETPDQLQAINAVIHDMSSDKPMDRLVCGDVGFGKTEVAMRAAFIAALNGKQVAVLVPTTLLAQQHFQNFQDRFADWPFHIECMSRFKSAKEQQKIASQLAEGKIDIIIGTHKLLQDDIQFKNIGLVIIDEEHRFGVQQKERLKALRVNVDILALTATPIPRTLNMAFSGIRDLSIIATPPAKRLSIKTFVHEYQNTLIQEAISREIMRGGQVYFLHNDVATIEKTARELEKLIPEARISVAHGQLRERELEQIMSDFYHRRFNVLVCTTIIESGIDVPSANTIIINRADKLGLAQLHQLRGRVGRSHHQAYAYLLIPSHKLLTADAKKRLDAISSLEDLGAGFTLATHDLEIRGAGELLGEGQSGNMQAVGFTLYMDLLTRAVDALKAGKQPDLDITAQKGTEIELQLPAFIPESYLGDVQLRLQCYKRIASAKSASELDEIQVDMIDRFGLLPDNAKLIFELALLKQKAESLGIIKIEANSKTGKIEFADKPTIDPMRLIKLIQTQSHRYRLEGPTRLRFTLDSHEISQRIVIINQLIETLST